MYNYIIFIRLSMYLKHSENKRLNCPHSNATLRSFHVTLKIFQQFSTKFELTMKSLPCSKKSRHLSSAQIESNYNFSTIQNASTFNVEHNSSLFHYCLTSIIMTNTHMYTHTDIHTRSTHKDRRTDRQANNTQIHANTLYQS